MTVWHYLLLVAGGLLLIFFACLLPGRFLRLAAALGFNAALGLALLLLLNAFSGLTLPLNALTLSVSGLLGLPGMAAVAVIAAI